MTDIMLDLETLGTKPGCIVLSIGAVEFDYISGNLGEEFYCVISLRSSFGAGLKLELPTMKWWMQQSPQAQEVLQISNSIDLSLYSVLLDFRAFCTQYNATKENPLHIWGNGTGFDETILSAAYDKTILTVPWEYYNTRCHRTLKNLIKPDIPFQGTTHNALDDAKHQAREAIYCLRQLKGL